MKILDPNSISTISTGNAFAAGGNRFLCDDLLSPMVHDWLAAERPMDFAYTDPPWDARILRTFYTWASRPHSPNLETLFKGLAALLADNVRHSAFVEIGLRAEGCLKYAFESAGWALQNRFEVRYGTPSRPSLLLLFNRGKDSLPIDGTADGLHGEAVTRWAFEQMAKHIAGARVLDPCVGLGMTARMCHAYNMQCYGAELNPNRLSRTLLWLKKHGYNIKAL